MVGPAAASVPARGAAEAARPGLERAPAARSLAPRRRHSGRAAAAAQVQDAPPAGWFTRSNSFASIRSPHRLQAELLERACCAAPVLEVPANRDEAIVLMERLQQETAAQGSADGLNVVPFTGGSGPALLAYLLASVFDGAVVACIPDAGAIPPEQAEHARFVADLLGIELLEASPALWQQAQLPAALAAGVTAATGVSVFCGATADDLCEACGAASQRHEGLAAPLAGLSRAAVNALTRAVGLPDWAASAPESAAAAAAAAAC